MKNNLTIQRSGNTYNAYREDLIWYIRNVNNNTLTGKIIALRDNRYRVMYVNRNEKWVDVTATAPSLEDVIAFLIDKKNEV